jgi:hypothetical protein
VTQSQTSATAVQRQQVEGTLSLHEGPWVKRQRSSENCFLQAQSRWEKLAGPSRCRDREALKVELLLPPLSPVKSTGYRAMVRLMESLSGHRARKQGP